MQHSQLGSRRCHHSPPQPVQRRRPQGRLASTRTTRHVVTHDTDYTNNTQHTQHHGADDNTATLRHGRTASHTRVRGTASRKTGRCQRWICLNWGQQQRTDWAGGPVQHTGLALNCRSVTVCLSVASQARNTFGHLAHTCALYQPYESDDSLLYIEHTHHALPFHGTGR